MVEPFQKHRTPSSFSDMNHPVGSFAAGLKFWASIRGSLPEQIALMEESFSFCFLVLVLYWDDTEVSGVCLLPKRESDFLSVYFFVCFK